MAAGVAGGLAALKPAERADTGAVRSHPELFGEAAALRLELPGRPAAQIASILYHRHGIAVAERTVRGQLRRAGLHREALAAEPKAYGRYEAARPNERWITDVLAGPGVPWPRRDGSARARLFLIVDDHSRLLVDGRFFAHENARACQDLLRRRSPAAACRKCSTSNMFRGTYSQFCSRPRYAPGGAGTPVGRPRPRHGRRALHVGARATVTDPTV